MNVIDTRSNVPGICLVDEYLEQLSVALAVLNTEHISVQRCDSMEEVLEFRVTKVGVDLSGVRNAAN